MATVRNTIDALDDVIHQKVRLAAMSLLVATGAADFNYLKADRGRTARL
jgi:hypothetical protein